MTDAAHWDDALRIEVYGTPVQQGSKNSRAIYKGTGENRTFTGKTAMYEQSAKTLKPWREAVAYAARVAMTGRELLTGPVELRVTFYMPRPKGHFGQGKNSDRLRPSAPQWPTTKPDKDKLERAIGDALKGIVYRDDAQIVHTDSWKVYAGDPWKVYGGGHAPGATIFVLPLDGER